jgi:DNA-binding transcriptional MerR regulator
MMDEDTLRFPWEEDEPHPAAEPIDRSAQPQQQGPADPRADEHHAAPASGSPRPSQPPQHPPAADLHPQGPAAPAAEAAASASAAAADPAASWVTAAPASAPASAASPAASAAVAPAPAAASVAAAPAPASVAPVAASGAPGATPTRRGEPVPRPLVRKEYYAISEVADLVGLPAHVLRYWESQFAVLNPSKNRSGNRVYQRKEIKLILLVKQLLHDEKYTVEGAKQKLEQLRRGGTLGESTARALDQQLVAVLRDELLRVSELLTEPVD